MRALLTGCSGQDGRYLSEHLAELGYDVYGLVHGQRNPHIPTLLRENPALHILEGDLTDFASLLRAVDTAVPDEVYNLAAISHVGMSFTQPELTAQVTGVGAARLFEAVRMRAPDARVYQASTSEMYGNYFPALVRGMWEYDGITPALNETHPFAPVSPYGAAKLYAHTMAAIYRASYGLHVSCGILFNHESPRRGSEFVTQKIVQGLARAKWNGVPFTLGNIDATRDWGHARDYTRAMHLMLQQDQADDYVIATGVPHTVRDVLDTVAFILNVDWHAHVTISPGEQRPTDIDYLCGDPAYARKVLNWEPSTTFEQLLAEMCEAA